MLKPSTKKIAQGLINKNADMPVADITYRWAVEWVAAMKSGVNRVRPDTIKKDVQTLRNALDWYFREYWLMAGMEMPGNPLAQLPRNYSVYDQADPNRLVNTKRDRRLVDGEERAIEGVITGRIKRKCNRPFRARRLKNGMTESPADLLMFFRLVVNSGLRMREGYRLRMRDIELDKEVIHVRRSKLTDEYGRVSGERSLPMVPQLAAWLSEYVMLRGLRQGSEDIVFPWWKGETDIKALDTITSALSQRFAAIFRDAGCERLTEHDLRHEATTRFCELRYPDGGRMYTKDEVMTFTGHTEEVTFERYKKLFTEDITPRALLARRMVLAGFA